MLTAAYKYSFKADSTERDDRTRLRVQSQCSTTELSSPVPPVEVIIYVPYFTFKLKITLTSFPLLPLFSNTFKIVKVISVIFPLVNLPSYVWFTQVAIIFRMEIPSLRRFIQDCDRASGHHRGAIAYRMIFQRGVFLYICKTLFSPRASFMTFDVDKTCSFITCSLTCGTKNM